MIERLAAGALLSASLLVCVARGEPRQVYLPELRRDAPELAAELSASAEAAPEERARALHALLRRCGDVALAGRLVPRYEAEAPPGHERLLGLRAELCRRAAALPEQAARALAALQEEAATLELRTDRPPGDELLALRYPFAPSGRAAATRLLDAALEAGDLGRARLLAEELGLAPGARSLLGPPAPRPAGEPAPEGALLTVQRIERFEQAPEQQGGLPSPAVPAWVGGRVCVSNGAELRAYDADGELVGAVPLDPHAASRPLPSAREHAVAGWGELAFAPLVLDRWLAPGRGEARDERGSSRDGSFGGRFHALVALHAPSGRLAWWDGDPGPTSPASGPRPGSPPGWDRAGPELRDLLARGHVLACVADEARVYTALALQGEATELQLMAYRRVGTAGQPLALAPAWPRPAFVLAAERPAGRSGEDRPPAPEVSAALTLDRSGRLVCTTDLGVVACFDAARGLMLWARRAPVEAERERSRFEAFRGRRTTPREAPPTRAEPAACVAPPNGARTLVALVAPDVLGLRPADGELLWRARCPRADRLAGLGERLAVYGGERLVVLGADGARQLEHPTAGAVRGRLARFGDTLVLPAERSRGAGEYQLLQLRLRGADLRPTGAVPLDLREPFNLLAVPGGAVAASRRHVVFLRWMR